MKKEQEVTPPLASTSDILSLLQFQQKLLNLVHAELYAQPEIDDDTIVRFQVKYVTEMNQSWRKMVDDLMFRLVKQKMHYDGALRDHFHKTLNIDYLPFLRINRYELTQVSLFGFDIYIEPLSAILQILNRIDGQRHVLSNRKIPPQQLIWAEKPRDVWQRIRYGWDQLMYESALFKLSLNVYMLKEYVKTAAKSLLKKDKEIIFTGCCNIFSDIVSILKKNKEIWLLCQLAQLNNQLYQFHPSFNYSHFFSLLFPLCNEYEPIFRSIRVVGEKCLNASLLTPLLLALLRNRESFHAFIQEVDDQCWTPYLNGLVFGLILNFKARILEYEEALQILQKAIQKLGLIGQLDTSYFVGQLGKQWGQARDYFISALKVGYNVGQLQTWHPIDNSTIQQRIIAVTRNSILMHSLLPKEFPTKLYFPNGFQPQLEACLQEVTGNLLNITQMVSNYSPNIIEAVEIKQISGVLKLQNLLKLCNLSTNVNCMSYTIELLNKIFNANSAIVIKRLTAMGDEYCEAAIKQLEKQQKGKEDLKEVLFAYIKKNKPTEKLDQIVRVCLMISGPKQAISEILSIVQSHNDSNSCELVAANIVAMYCPERLGALTKVKTFQKQYSIESEIINLNNRLYLCCSVLIDNIINRNSGQSIDILIWMARLADWLVVPLLSFPVSSRYDNEHNKKLETLSTYLITNSQHYPILLQLLSIGLNITSPQVKTYFSQICLSSVCDQIVIEINTVLNKLCELQDNMQYRYIINLLILFVKVYDKSKNTQSNALIRKVMKLYLRAIEKLDGVLVNVDDQAIVSEIVDSLVEVYCPLVEFIYENSKNSRNWRIYMRKTCLTSLDISIQHVSNARDCQLPSIRKDKGFLIHNSVQVSKDKDNTAINIEGIKSKVENLKKIAAKYTNPNQIQEKREQFLSPLYQTKAEQVRDFVLDQSTIGVYSKENVLPALSLKLIKLLYTKADKMEILITELLSMNASNHHKLIEYCLLNKNIDILLKIGLSKQSVQKLLPQILAVLSPEQLIILTSSLDTNSKKNISDNFNFMLMKQQQNCNNVPKIRQMIIDLSASLGFLLVYNQSNWRYANEVINQFASTKMSGLANTASLLLQYMEYIRITYQPNTDYEGKVGQYLEILLAYQCLLGQKYEYIKSLESTSMMPQKSLRQSTMSEETISNEEIVLFKINQLAYIGSFCEAWNAKDLLFRAAELRKQIQSAKDIKPFSQILELIDHIVGRFYHINSTVNLLAGGNVMCPDFIHSYYMCSDNSYEKAKITLGESLQGYFTTISKKVDESWKFLPFGKPCPITPYLQKYVPTADKPLPVPQTLRPQIINKNDQATKKIIIDKYQQLQKLLTQSKIIIIDKQELQIQGNTEEQSQNSSLWLFYYGVLYKSMDLTGQKKPKLSKTLESIKQRQVLSFQDLKAIDSQGYHQIKAVLVDQELQKSKYTFSYKGQPLVPQGLSIEVNKLNRQKYCNLVAKSCLGETLLKRLASFMQGLYSVV